ncbi:hypothetical protein PENTCL1PPCAC_9448 [Pristionchus entomophagus]|uniref:Uncharacterized protein n=1 Tax=Pristionchus entomophagus TaxID=358040 RepID=A0AAV5SVW4_9BILA|nr:hypothetical protein PENTCL1PPCAC_9448 [Pristionchus entomophagus]
MREVRSLDAGADEGAESRGSALVSAAVEYYALHRSVTDGGSSLCHAAVDGADVLHKRASAFTERGIVSFDGGTYGKSEEKNRDDEAVRSRHG